MIVSRFGVHWAAGVPFLHQGSGSQNLISRELQSPFVVQVRPKKLRCPHEIDLASAVDADWIQDPLAQALLPVPGSGIKLFRGDADLVQTLTRLCSPTEPLIRPVWWTEARHQTPAYALTNVTPMVFLVTDHDTRNVIRHINLAQVHGRRMLFVTRDRLPIFDGEWIETELTHAVSEEPLEAIGAGALRRHMLEVPPEC